MTWYSPRTWINGETPPVATWNEQFRDNLLELNGTTSEWADYGTTLFLTNITSGNYTRTARVKTVAKTVFVQASFAINNTSTGIVSVTGLPAIARAGVILGSALVSQSGIWYVSIPTAFGIAGQTQSALAVHGTALKYYGGTGYTFASGDGIYLDLMYEGT